MRFLHRVVACITDPDVERTTPMSKIVAIPFHPISGLFPLMNRNAFADLVKDVKANGLMEPAVLYDGKILDGRNRYRACARAGVECKFQTYNGSDPVSFVVSLNLRRRHLTASQRRMVAARLARLGRGRRWKKSWGVH